MEMNNDKIKVLVNANRHYTTRDVAEILNISKSSVENDLKALRYVNKLDIRILHQLEKIHLIKRITICDSFLKHKENDPFFKHMITGNEKWIVYSNIEWKRSCSKNDEAQTISKTELYQRKVVYKRTSVFENVGSVSRETLKDV